MHKWIRDKKTEKVYLLLHEKVKMYCNPITDWIAYLDTTNSEILIITEFQLSDFTILESCSECDGSGMTMGCFCDNPKCHNGYIK